MPSFHPSYIEKSNENWACVENLLKQASRFPNVIASRMYYSMFQLVKCEMVTNNEDPSLPRDMKMTENASTGVHKLVRDYINSYLVKKTKDYTLGRKWNELYSLSLKADYTPGSVTLQEVWKSFNAWHNTRINWISDLESKGGIS